MMEDDTGMMSSTACEGNRETPSWTLGGRQPLQPLKQHTVNSTAPGGRRRRRPSRDLPLVDRLHSFPSKAEENVSRYTHSTAAVPPTLSPHTLVHAYTHHIIYIPYIDAMRVHDAP